MKPRVQQSCVLLRSNPFNDRNLALFLSQRKLESLELHGIYLNSEVSCRAVATAQVRNLTLEYCELEDEGAALVESVGKGRGPKELCFHGNSFGSSESFVTFLNALRGDAHLERLHLSNSIDDHEETRSLLSPQQVSFHIRHSDDKSERASTNTLSLQLLPAQWPTMVAKPRQLLRFFLH
jgi:hypothetical protein